MKSLLAGWSIFNNGKAGQALRAAPEGERQGTLFDLLDGEAEGTDRPESAGGEARR